MSVATKMATREDTSSIIVAMQDFLTKRGNSYRSLEALSSVNRLYIRRIVEGEIPLEKASVYKVYHVLSSIVGERRAHELLLAEEVFEEKIRDLIVGPSDGFQRLARMDTVLENRDTTIVGFLAMNHDGTTRDEIQRAVGDNGLYAVEALKRKKIIIEVQGRLHWVEGLKNESAIFTLSRGDARGALRHLIPCYRPEYPHREGTHHIMLATERVSQDFAARAHQKLRELHEWLKREIPKEENRGSIPIFIGGIMDRILGVAEEKNSKGGEEEDEEEQELG